MHASAILANCPVHGVAVFRYMAACDWWECADDPECRFVVPAEHVDDAGVEVPYAVDGGERYWL